MIELKLGRPVLAWQCSTPSHMKEGYWVMQIKSGKHLVKIPDIGGVFGFDFVKPDPDGAPMNGDEVEWYNGKETKVGRYIGKRADGLDMIERDGLSMIVASVRFPQPSKQDRVIKVINDFMEVPGQAEHLANQINKIYDE